jgi:hypothetical protein
MERAETIPRTSTHRVGPRGLTGDAANTYKPGTYVDAFHWNLNAVNVWVAGGRLVPRPLSEAEIFEAAELRREEAIKRDKATVRDLAPKLAELNRKADELAADGRAIEAQTKRQGAVLAEHNATVLERNVVQVRLDEARARLGGR